MVGEKVSESPFAPDQKKRLLKLLIVDDESYVCAGLQRNISWESLGVSVIGQAEDGARALEIVERSTPDIVLSDVRMPVMDGLEMAARIRTISPRCKIIFMSAFTDKEYLKSAINLGALSYVEKPILIAEVSKAIGRAASKHYEEKVQESAARDAILLEIVSGVASGDQILEFQRLTAMRLSSEQLYVVSVSRFSGQIMNRSPRQQMLENTDFALAHARLFRRIGVLARRRDYHAYRKNRKAFGTPSLRMSYPPWVVCSFRTLPSGRRVTSESESRSREYGTSDALTKHPSPPPSRSS